MIAISNSSRIKKQLEEDLKTYYSGRLKVELKDEVIDYFRSNS